ncbi:Potassium voltage-gated channel subfamily B member 2 [Symbiodinium microadriaticum]|uniref:Potassium voltage-gated channel subfamily B member 2 n=1 Tax=Symbiodinium microadriaticum TaxID=2951 RepID=A0A1Q9C5X1_SYMMI|nr:Potassium voltage-gated channel subfamily B member 2 [Symbiodinium microadriaticum]CAE7213435.1 KCNB2 [Symbiodinium microadriaticum]CAE7942724.1 KCNB2 [Symbiodinium sp. KB8]
MPTLVCLSQQKRWDSFSSGHEGYGDTMSSWWGTRGRTPAARSRRQYPGIRLSRQGGQRGMPQRSCGHRRASRARGEKGMDTTATVACPLPTCRGPRRKMKPLALQEEGVARRQGPDAERRLLTHLNRGQKPPVWETRTPPTDGGLEPKPAGKAFMEAVDILDQIVLDYDPQADDFTMDPATLQDELLRTRGAANATWENLLDQDSKGGSNTTNPMPEEGEEQQHPGTKLGTKQAQSSATTTRPTSPPPLSNCRSGDSEGKLIHIRNQKAYKAHAQLRRPLPRTPGTRRRTGATTKSPHYHEKQEPTRGGGNQEQGENPGPPNPIRRARSQASALLASISSETQAAAEYAPNAEDLGHQHRADYAAEALELITQAMGLANDVGVPGVVDYLAAAGARLSQLHVSRARGTDRGGKALPTPNAFEIAALTVGIMVCCTGIVEEQRRPKDYVPKASLREWATARFEKGAGLNKLGAGPRPEEGRLAKKRISNASMADFFKREPAVSRVWLFLEDPDSSRSAYWFATLSNYFVCLSIIFTIWQASLYPPLSGMVEGIIQIAVEVLMLLEFIVRWIASGPKREFVRNPYNVIDLAAFIPTIVRLASGVETPSTARNPFSHYVLVCFVPVIRQLKLIRRFQKLQLLLHVLTTVFDALKLLLFLVCLIVLFFAAVLYIVEPNDANAVDSLPTSIWLCIVTVTTVGYGDVAPTTWPGRIVAGTLCFISVLFMAMPLSVLGNAMSQTWADRHRILLMTRTRSRLKNLGYSADDMPKLFKKFDTDNNGELELEEFVDLVAAMKVGVKPHEASELFMAFDSDGNGGIDEREFMKALFPLDYRRMYRRASGMTFGA